MRDNKYTSSKNRIPLTITSNLMVIFQEMAEEWRFELNMTRPMTRCMDVHEFSECGVKILDTETQIYK